MTSNVGVFLLTPASLDRYPTDAKYHEAAFKQWLIIDCRDDQAFNTIV
ncbi:MAG: hypothetical protein WCK53_16190 [Methanomicrobiales archaeon]